MATQPVTIKIVKATLLTIRIPVVRARRCFPTGRLWVALAEGELYAITIDHSNFHKGFQNNCGTEGIALEMHSGRA